MGTQMTKELGVYNEEEKVHTPLAPQRYRLLNNDPRSVTLGINRTPIQVESTPTKAKPADEVLHDNEIEEKDSATDEHETSEIHLAMCETDAEESGKHISAELNVKYLETNIDLLDLSSSGSDRRSKKREKPIHTLSADVRSPSLLINRTPVLVQCTPEMFALQAHMDSFTFSDIDVHVDDPSVIVSEDDQTSLDNQSSINNWLVNVDQKFTDTSLASPSLESPRTVARKQKELNKLKKHLFFTPDLSEAAKETVKPKGRTPLGNLQAGQLHDSPQKIMRAKQWRTIQEERQQRGIPDTENTPPNLPPLSKISSAPSKILGYKRTKINWDEDNALLI